MPRLKQAMSDDEKLMVQRELSLAPGEKINLKALPEALAGDAEVVRSAIAGQPEKKAEGMVRGALDRSWQPEVLDIYANLGPETFAKRIKTCEKWRKAHIDDPALELCIGRIQELAGNREAALACYERSHAIRPSAAAGTALGRMHAQVGEHAKSNAYLLDAMSEKP